MKAKRYAKRQCTYSPDRYHAVNPPIPPWPIVNSEFYYERGVDDLPTHSVKQDWQDMTAHGSAPDIAGKGIANPIATILSVAMMLERIGMEDMRAGAEMTRAAVRTVFADPAARTRDMGSDLTTRQMTGLIRSALQSRPQHAATL